MAIRKPFVQSVPNYQETLSQQAEYFPSTKDVVKKFESILLKYLPSESIGDNVADSKKRQLRIMRLWLDEIQHCTNGSELKRFLEFSPNDLVDELLHGDDVSRANNAIKEIHQSPEALACLDHGHLLQP